MAKHLLFCLIIVCCIKFYADAAIIKENINTPQVAIFKTENNEEFQLNVKHVESKHERFIKLTKADSKILSGIHKDIQITVADIDELGNPVFHKWTPDLKAASSHIYVNTENRAGFNIKSDNENGFNINGYVENLLVKKKGREYKVENIRVSRKDYINVPGNLTFDNIQASPNFAPLDATVEFVIVADKEFCDVFNHDYQKILEYFIVMMWDVNLRYKTFPNTRISWQLNGIVAVANTDAQPFIEESRAEDGRVNHNRVLEKFANWVYNNLGNLPPLDIASVVTNAEQEWGGGLAYMSAACRSGSGNYIGTSVWNDGGNYGALNVMAHELGHNLGAPHDGDENVPECDVGGTYIMGGSSDEHRHFFSSCSDRTIGEYVRSDQASCLQELSSNSPVTSPDFNDPPAPTIGQQCAVRHPEDPNTWTSEETCKSSLCFYTDAEGVIWYHGFPPLDNSPCESSGRCFRGKCRQAGYLVRNVGSGLCMEATNNFDKTAPILMNNCPVVGTALQRFVFTTGLHGIFLETPYIESGGESLDKCLYTGNAEGNGISTDTCNLDHDDPNDNPWHGWELVEIPNGNGQFLLKHVVSGRCAIPSSRDVGAQVLTYAACDENNLDYRWTRDI